jgi:hypothetical protein
MNILRVRRLAGFPMVLLILFLLAAGIYCSYRGDTPLWIACSFAASILMVWAYSLLQKATVGADQLTTAHSPEGALAGCPTQPGASPEEPTREMILTPSEVVYLSGNRFVPPGAPLAGYRLVGSGVSISKRELAEQVYAAAFLAAEKAGVLHFAISPKKTLLGLRTVQALYADPTGRTSPYPFNSLESRLLSLGSGPNEVQRILHDLIPESADPFAQANHLVGSYLADRGLLRVSRSKELLVFTKTEVQLPARMAELATDRVNEVKSLLSECQEARPELWKKLIDDISKGISSRQYQDDNFGPSW